MDPLQGMMDLNNKPNPSLSSRAQDLEVDGVVVVHVGGAKGGPQQRVADVENAARDARPQLLRHATAERARPASTAFTAAASRRSSVHGAL